MRALTSPAIRCWCCALLMLSLPAAAAAQEQWQVGSAPSVFSGRYGTDTRTDVFYTPVTARRLFDQGDVAVVLPMLCVWGSGGLVVVNGSPIVPDRRTRAGASAEGVTPSRPAARGSTPIETPIAAAAAPVTSACGPGDVIVRARYYVLDGRGNVPSIAVRGHVKAPTADADRGLGTGKPDEGVGVEVSQPIGPVTALLLDGGYTAIGKPAGTDYRNTWWYDVGISRDLASGRVNVSAFFEEYGAVVPGTAIARDVLAAVTVKLAGGWRVQASGLFGLSDGSPDRGLSFGLSRRF